MSKKLAFKIYIDDKSGEIESIQTTKRFAEEGPLFKLDVIKDIIIALEQIYNIEKSECFNEYNQTGIA